MARAVTVTLLFILAVVAVASAKRRSSIFNFQSLASRMRHPGQTPRLMLSSQEVAHALPALTRKQNGGPIAWR
ncbi:hypothetical protein MTO96_042723 [Rhipicephalus appendiculatus]